MTYSPNKSLFLLGGLIGGLLLGLAIAVGVEALDHSIKTVQDAEDLLPFPVLATIPHGGGSGSLLAGNTPDATRAQRPPASRAGRSKE